VPSRPATLEGMLTLLERRAPQAHIELGLERVAQVFSRLAPDLRNSRIITVGGTNGKGSTVAFLEAIAHAAGKSCLAYTSPHIVDFTERFRFNGSPVSESEVAEALRSVEQAVEQARDGTELTWFEHVTLAAFVLAGQRRPDWLVLEVGLGGRLDAVNIIDADVAVITSIGLDHQRWLGRTRAAIAREKCGIARAGRPIFVAERNPPAGMREILAERGAEARFARGGFEWRWRGDALDVEVEERRLTGLRPGLAGAQQGGNAAAALGCALVLEPALDDARLAKAIGAARLSGRFQTVLESPRVVVDVAHNPAAARALARQIRRLPAPRRAVFAALDDKDVGGVVRAVDRHVDHWYLAGLQPPRGLSSRALRERIGVALSDERCEALESVPRALDAAISGARLSGSGSVVVFGSFLTAEAALIHMRRQQPPEIDG